MMRRFSRSSYHQYGSSIFTVVLVPFSCVPTADVEVVEDHTTKRVSVQVGHIATIATRLLSCEKIVTVSCRICFPGLLLKFVFSPRTTTSIVSSDPMSDQGFYISAEGGLNCSEWHADANSIQQINCERRKPLTPRQNLVLQKLIRFHDQSPRMPFLEPQPAEVGANRSCESWPVAWTVPGCRSFPGGLIEPFDSNGSLRVEPFEPVVFVPRTVRCKLLSELAIRCCWLDSCAELVPVFLDRAAEEMGLEVKFTGICGIRRKYQKHKLAQLVVVTRGGGPEMGLDHSREAEMNGLDSVVSGGIGEADSGSAEVSKRFAKEDGEPEEGAESSSPAGADHVAGGDESVGGTDEDSPYATVDEARRDLAALMERMDIWNIEEVEDGGGAAGSDTDGSSPRRQETTMASSDPQKSVPSSSATLSTSENGTCCSPGMRPTSENMLDEDSSTPTVLHLPNVGSDENNSTPKCSDVGSTPKCSDENNSTPDIGSTPKCSDENDPFSDFGWTPGNTPRASTPTSSPNTPAKTKSVAFSSGADSVHEFSPEEEEIVPDRVTLQKQKANEQGIVANLSLSDVCPDTDILEHALLEEGCDEDGFSATTPLHPASQLVLIAMGHYLVTQNPVKDPLMLEQLHAISQRWGASVFWKKEQNCSYSTRVYMSDEIFYWKR